MKTKIFKKGDKVKYIKEPTQIDWVGVGEVSIPFKINDVLEVYGYNSRSGSIYFKEKGFSYPNICFELYQETYKYEVVHTETQEQWDFVLTKIKNTVNNTSKGFISYKEESGLNINSGSQADVPWWRETYKENIKIYSFEEWLDKFGHKSEYLKQNQKQEQWIPQVGDWIYSNRLGCWYYSDCKHPVKIVEIKDDKFRYDLFSNTKTNRFKKGDISEYYGFSGIVRKALPHEIPTQELSKEDLLAEAERRYPVGTQFKSALIGDTNPYIGFVKKGMYFSKSENVIWNGDSVGFIYDNGEWAKIVEKPKVTEKSLTKSLVHSMQDDFKDLQVKSMYFEKPLDWSQVLRATGEFSFGTPSQKPVKNNKILPIKVRNSNITEPTELPKRTKIKIIKKQLLTI